MDGGVTRAIAALAGLLLAVAAPTAAAQSRLSLSWSAPAACPTSDAVESEVARLLVGPIPTGGSPIVATADATEVDGRFELRLGTEVDGERGERTLRADRCDELAAAAALILALMIDPEAVARAELPPEETPLPEEPPAPRETPSLGARLAAPTVRATITESERAIEPARDVEIHAEPPPQERPSESDVVSAMLGAGVGLDVGTLPSAAPAVVIEGGVGVPLIDGRIRAVLLLPQSAANPMALPGVSGELMAFTGSLMSCLRPIAEARAIGVCADLSGGAVWGTGRGVSEPLFGAGFWLAAGGGLDLAWQPAPWFDLELMAEVLGQITAPIFDVVVTTPDGERTVTLWSPPGVTGRFSLSAHVRF